MVGMDASAAEVHEFRRLHEIVDRFRVAHPLATLMLFPTML
jgi:hypothetical protein